MRAIQFAAYMLLGGPVLASAGVTWRGWQLYAALALVGLIDVLSLIRGSEAAP